MRIIGIDPGLSTGWAVCTGENTSCGVWQLRDPHQHPLGVFASLLHGLIGVGSDSIDLIVYEEPVARGNAARRLNQQLGAIIVVAEECKIPHYPVNPATLKKWATGNGRADKDQMAIAAHRHGVRVTQYGTSLDDHNAVDAALLALYGRDVVLPTMEAIE